MSFFDTIMGVNSAVRTVLDILDPNKLTPKPYKDDFEEQLKRQERKERACQAAASDLNDRVYTQDEAVEMLNRINRYNEKIRRDLIHPYIEIKSEPIDVEVEPYISEKTGEPEADYYVSGGYEITLTLSAGDYVKLIKHDM